MAFALRDYQETAISDVRVAFRLYQFLILVLATGAGKTVIFSHMARSAAAKGKRILIIAHRDQLIKQASRKLSDNGARHGIIMAGYTEDRFARIQVASVQTLARRLKPDVPFWFEPDLIVIDETHLAAAASYIKVLNMFPNAKVLGVTGSPCRLDNKALGREHGGIFEHMITGISIRQLIERGFLVRPTVYAPAEQIDLSGIKKAMGDYDQEQLAAVMDKPKLIGDAVDQYERICNGVPGVAWCVTVAHAQHVADAFNARGITAVMLCGDHDTDYRDKVLKQLATGEVKIVTFVGILVEGVDVPEIGAVLLLRPTMSLASYLQVIGRGLRPADGKTCCYVLDHAGLSFKHGLADEERDWSLDWGEKKKKGKKKAPDEKVDVIQCKGCYACFSPDSALAAAARKRATEPEFTAERCCPNCGKEVETKLRKIENESGELEEITPEMAARMKKNKKREVDQARTLEDLLRIAAERGYSSGWAQNLYGARKRKKDDEQADILAARIEKMIGVFAKYGVTVEMLESSIGHDVKLCDERELAELTTVFNKIKTGSPVTDFFTLGHDGEQQQELPVF